MKLTTITSRIILLLFAVCLVMAHAGDAEAKKRKRGGGKKQTISRAAGINDPRYAAIIMNPVTGEIYHQQNADARRYPASLTKMMTLYLLFEALEQKKISLDDRMDVSELASRQAQTNLSLDPGDRIDVETAIKALVIRSANDVSVVVAETLGGDVETFALMMTNKARSLGMKSTIFKNPNGLPNTGQVTTARDMAKLGIALKRDFPRYYRFFSALQFSHNGVTYYTHNRVMLRYAGVDGIKTGFIGMSGFNLVTSVVRGGRPLVGAVMGGGSGKWRDDRMIKLLDDSYKIVANRGAARGKLFPANLPLSKGGGKQTAGIADTDATGAPVETLPAATIPDAGESEDGATAADQSLPVDVADGNNISAKAASPFDAVQPAAVAAKVSAPAAPPPTKPEVKPVPTKPAVNPIAKAEPVKSNKAKDAAVDTGWGIQVGAFSSQLLADQALADAQKIAERQLIGAKPLVVGPSIATESVYRARLDMISQPQAKKACEVLITASYPCFIYKTAPDAPATPAPTP